MFSLYENQCALKGLLLLIAFPTASDPFNLIHPG